MTPVLAVEFYSQVLIELVGAFGAALLVANVFALVRRRAAESAESAGPTATPGETHATAPDDDGNTLTRAPIARSLLFAAIGAVMLVWALASYFSS